MKWTHWLRIGLAVLLVAAVVGALDWLPIKPILVRLLDRIQDAGYWGPPLVIGIFVLVCLFSLPSPAMILAAGFLFGPIGGGLTAMAGALLGAAAAFFLSRSAARRWIERKELAHPRFQAVDRAIAGQGLKVVILLRLCSIPPYAAASYLLGLTRVAPSHFLLGTVIGRLPAILIYTYLGSTAKNLVDLTSGKVEVGVGEQVLLGLGLVAMAATTWFITRLARRSLRETLDRPPPAS